MFHWTLVHTKCFGDFLFRPLNIYEKYFKNLLQYSYHQGGGHAGTHFFSGRVGISKKTPVLWGDAIYCACVGLFIMPELLAQSDIEIEKGRTKQPAGLKRPALREAMHMRSPRFDFGEDTKMAWGGPARPMGSFTGYEHFAEARRGPMVSGQSNRTYT